MRQGDALPDSSAANPFAFLQGRQNCGTIQLGEGRGNPSQFVQQCLFVAGTQPRNDQIYHA